MKEDYYCDKYNILNKRLAITFYKKGVNKMLNEYSDVLSVQELAKILHISKHSAYKLVSEDIIHSHRIGKIYRIPKCCVIDYLRSAQHSKK